MLTAQGTPTNSIPAAAFGFTSLISCGNLVDIAGSKVIPAAVDPTRNIIILGGGASGAPADVTSAEAYIMVEGIVSGYAP